MKKKIDESLLELNIDLTIEESESELEQPLPPEKREEILDDYIKYVKGTLNSWYHTYTLVVSMFLGYLITGFKYFGFKIWKDKTTVVFYIVIALLSLLIFFLDLKRDILKERFKGESKDE